MLAPSSSQAVRAPGVGTYSPDAFLHPFLSDDMNLGDQAAWAQALDANVLPPSGGDATRPETPAGWCMDGARLDGDQPLPDEIPMPWFKRSAPIFEPNYNNTLVPEQTQDANVLLPPGWCVDGAHLDGDQPLQDEIPMRSAQFPETSCNDMLDPEQSQEFGDEGEPCFTTAMIRNIACKIDKASLAECLDSHGLAGMYDGIYVPTNPARRANLGYAFVNFHTPDGVELCKDVLTGVVLGDSLTEKTCEVSLACVQGTVSHSRSRRRGGAWRQHRAWRRQADGRRSKQENIWSL